MMARLILITALLLIAYLPVKTQNGQCLGTTNPPKELFGRIERMPYLLLKTEGATDIQAYRKQTQQLLLQFIYRHFRYPPISRSTCISGTVVVRFTIGADGLIVPGSIRCIRDIGGGFGKEAKRVIQLIADLSWRWVPGTQVGIPVPVQYNLPVRISLE